VGPATAHARACAQPLLPHVRGGPAGLAYLLHLARYSGRARDSVLDAVPAAGDLCAKRYCNAIADGYAVPAADSLSLSPRLSVLAIFLFSSVQTKKWRETKTTVKKDWSGVTHGPAIGLYVAPGW
jgi:hypothetical protein